MTRVLFVYATWDKVPKGLYPRNKQLLEELKLKHDRVEEIRIKAPKGMVQYLLADVKLIGKLIAKAHKKYDEVVIGYENLFFSMIITKYMTRAKFYTKEFLYSKWYTFVHDYKHKLNKIIKKAFYLSDKTDIKHADKVIFDTEEHRNMLIKYFPEIKNKYYEIKYVHTDYELFDPKKFKKKNHKLEDRVFFHGGFIPLQGTPIITKAMAQIPEAHIMMVGRGHDFRKAMDTYYDIIRKDKTPEQIMNEKNNLMLFEYFEYDFLPRIISEAKVCLGGPFGSSEKAKVVITNKTFEYLAMNKKVIVGDTPANKHLLELFPDKKHLIYFCELNNSKALISKIREALGLDMPGKTKSNKK